MKSKPFDREKAVQYAKKWALARNPRYFNFDGIGGDCTNFASQCLYAGCGVMNYKKDVGWYYNSPTDRAAAWSGVKYLYKFLTANTGVGLVGRKATCNELQTGDVIFLTNGKELYHTLIVAEISNGMPLVCCHTADAYLRPLNTYHYATPKYVHIEKINVW